METLEDILKLWEKDSQVDSTEPGRELLKIPVLHSKYLNILVKNKLLSKKMNMEYSKLRKVKEEYYNGDISQEELESRGWEPFALKIKTKLGIERYIEADDDLNNLLKKKILNDETVYVCESILQELKSRTFQLRDYIQWERFIGGN